MLNLYNLSVSLIALGNGPVWAAAPKDNLSIPSDPDPYSINSQPIKISPVVYIYCNYSKLRRWESRGRAYKECKRATGANRIGLHIATLNFSQPTGVCTIGLRLTLLFVHFV